MEENIDILRKATGKMSSISVEFDDIFSEVFIRLEKHIKLEQVEDVKVFRMYMAKVAYHVTSAMLKSSHVSTSILAGGTSGSVRRLNYEELKDAQSNFFDSIGQKYSHQAVEAREEFGHNFKDEIEFEQDLKTVLGGNALEVAKMMSQGYRVSEISRLLNIKMSEIRLNLVPRIKHALNRMMGPNEGSQR